MANRRPKGFIHDWNPKDETLNVLAAVRKILQDNAHYGPMTARQIFYQLVGKYEYEKTEQAYSRLCEYLVKARRARMIPFSAIRDDGGTSTGGAFGYETVDEFLDVLADYSTRFRMNPTLDQPHHVMIYCEAEGMVPMLGQMTSGRGVRVTGTGGFSSLTVTHEIAEQVVDRDKPTIFLHVGDYDPSGESIFESTCQDIGKFVAEMQGDCVYNPSTGETLEISGREFEPGIDGSFFIPRRVALTEEQVLDLNLPSSPPKRTDSRSANWTGIAATQAEAMDASDLDRIVNDAIDEWVDHDKLEEIEARETEGREAIGSTIKDAITDLREELSE